MASLEHGAPVAYRRLRRSVSRSHIGLSTACSFLSELNAERASEIFRFGTKHGRAKMDGGRPSSVKCISHESELCFARAHLSLLPFPPCLSGGCMNMLPNVSAPLNTPPVTSPTPWMFICFAVQRWRNHEARGITVNKQLCRVILP